MLRLFSKGPAEVNIISTVNPGEIPPIVLLMVIYHNIPPLHIIEDKLMGLRTLHAILLACSNRSKSNDLAT